MHNYTLLIMSTLVLFIGCRQTSEKNVEASAASSDSVLVALKSNHFEATFSETSNDGKGSAEGDFIFQRRGGLDYVLSELYKEDVIEIQDNPFVRKNFKIDIRWSKETNLNNIRNLLLKKVQQELGYTTRFDTVNVKVYELSVADNRKLKQAMVEKNDLPSGVNFKINTEKDTLHILATLPQAAKTLSQRVDRRIVSVPDSINYYRMSVNLSKDIIGQLKLKYGLKLNTIQKFYKQIDIDFK